MFYKFVYWKKHSLVFFQVFLSTKIQFSFRIIFIIAFVNEHGGCGVSSDYSGATKNYNYFAAACETNNIAEGLSEYIYNNVCKATDCKKNLHTFGHSLGAHTCGVAGYMLKQKGIVVPRLISKQPPYLYYFLRHQ